MQAVVVVVRGEEARHVVIVYEGDEVFLPSEVAVLGGKHVVYLREVRIRGEDASDGLVEREVQERDAALVRELVGVVIERVGGVPLIPLTKEEAIGVCV